MLRPALRALVTVVVLGSVLLSACTSRSFLESQKEAFAAIERFNARYLQAINQEDLALLSSLTTENHVMVPDDGEPITGKEALLDSMRDVFERFDIEESWTSEETVINGNTAFQRGSYTVHATPREGGEPVTSRGTFLRNYQRQDNGEWYMVVDRLSSDP